jgi:hypothetical protein
VSDFRRHTIAFTYDKLESAKGADARRQSEKKLREALGVVYTATVLREFPEGHHQSAGPLA